MDGAEGYKNGCEGTLKTFRFCMIPVVAQNLIQILKAPSSKIYFTSLIPDEFRGKLAYRLPLMLIQWEIWMGIVACTMQFIPIFYLHANPTAFMLKEMVP